MNMDITIDDPKVRIDSTYVVIDTQYVPVGRLVNANRVQENLTKQSGKIVVLADSAKSEPRAETR
jgi:hypothetical protein